MRRVLVVDDDLGVRRVLELALDDFNLTVATSSEEALALVQSGAEFDVAVFDVQMPGLTGLDLLAAVRADPDRADMPVVMLTGRVGEDDHHRAYTEGADAYVTKPFDPIALAELVESLLAQPAEERLQHREAEKSKADLLRELERRFQ